MIKVLRHKLQDLRLKTEGLEGLEGLEVKCCAVEHFVVEQLLTQFVERLRLWMLFQILQ